LKVYHCTAQVPKTCALKKKGKQYLKIQCGASRNSSQTVYYHACSPLTIIHMPRFYCPPPIPGPGSFNLPPDAAHHAARVLRLRAGDTVEIFDGNGHEYHCIISDISGKQTIIDIINQKEVERESPLSVLLAQAMTSSEKMDWVIQKATELGAAEIQPLATERSVARLSQDRVVKRGEHWQQVAISACEQCGRNMLPQIHPPLDIMVWLQQMRTSQCCKFILHPKESLSMRTQDKPQGTVILLIGPEGGFTEAEYQSAILCGFIPIRLGARVLRTETAAIAGLAALQTLWGDFNN
jgi:16S rRNA (uracil1498-N3)-methyltransferase